MPSTRSGRDLRSTNRTKPKEQNASLACKKRKVGSKTRGGGVDNSQNTITDKPTTLEGEIKATVAAAALSVTSPHGSTNRDRLQGGEGDENAPTQGRGCRAKKHTKKGASFVASKTTKKTGRTQALTPISRNRHIPFKKLTPSQLKNVPHTPSMSVDHITPNKGGHFTHDGSTQVAQKLNFDDTINRSTSNRKRKELSPVTGSLSSGGGGGGGDGGGSGGSGGEKSEAAQLQQQQEAQVAAAAALLAEEQEQQKIVAAAALLAQEQEQQKVVAAAALLAQEQEQQQAAAVKFHQQQEEEAKTGKTATTSSSTGAADVDVGGTKKQKGSTSNSPTGSGDGTPTETSAAATTTTATLPSSPGSKSSPAKTGSSKKDTESESEIKVTNIKTDGNRNDNNHSSNSMHSFVLPNVLRGIGGHILAYINNNIDHPAIKYDGDMNEKFISSPLNDVTVTRLEDLRVLSRDPHKIANKEKNPFCLYAGTAIFDLFALWTCDLLSKVIILPACSYTFMKKLDKREYALDCDIERYLRIKLPNGTKDLLNNDVIVLPIFGENHYSLAIMFYPSKAVNGSGKFVNHHPCILCANSLPGYGKSHHREVIDKVLRRFVNKFIKFHHPKSGSCNKNSFPSYPISVPKQPDSWSCLYQVIRMIHCTKQFVKNNPYGFTNTVASNLERFAQDNFSYDPWEGGTSLRSSLTYLGHSLLHIQRTLSSSYSSDNRDVNDGNIFFLKDFDTLKTEPIAILDDYNDDDDDDEVSRRDWKPVAPIHLPLKKLSELNPIKKESASDVKNQGRVRCLLKQRKEKAARRKFAGRANRSNNPDSEKEVEGARKNKSKKRLNGQNAWSLLGYKDEPFRKMLFRLMRTHKLFRSMSLFHKKKTNEKCLRMRTITILIDPIAEYPHLEGEDFDQERDEPLRLFIGDDIETVNYVLRELQMYRDTFQLVNNEYDIDEMIFGKQRPLIETLFGKKKSYEAQDDAIENAMLKEESEEITTPDPKDMSSRPTSKFGEAMS